MNQIQQLINQMCPNGVEWKTVKDICKRLNKGTLKTTDLTPVGYPVINSGITLYGYYNSYNNDGEAFTIAARGEYAGWVSYFNEKFWAGGLCYPYTTQNERILMTKFVFYYLKNTEKEIMAKFVSRGGIPAINQCDVEKIPIPVPPLAIQTRIVEILDHFTNLTANLTAELNLRRKQFEHYREKLLSLDGVEGVEWKKLGEVCDSISSGKNKSKSNNGQYIVYGSTGAIAKCNEYVYDKVQILIARVGANAGYVYLANGKYDVSDNTLIADLKKGISLQYVYYFLKHINLNKYAKGGGQPLVTSGEIKKIPIPVPPHATQHSIVSILDKFTALIENIEKELALRQKQYEYYREELLRFGG